MNKYTLHKLQEGFIVTSDEEVKTGDYFLHQTNADFSIHKCIERPGKQSVIGDNEINYFLGYCKKVIAQQDQIDFSGLSEEEQKEIGWFDKVALSIEATKNQSFANGKHEEIVAQIYYRRGFQKAQELLSDKKFTAKNLQYLLDLLTWTELTSQECIGACIDYIEDGFRDSSSWEVELEMEDWNFKVQDARNQLPTSPKIVDGKIKITKIL